MRINILICEFVITDLIDAFDLFDKNKDGQISTSELGPVMRALGQKPSTDRLEQIMKKADTSGVYIKVWSKKTRLWHRNTY